MQVEAQYRRSVRFEYTIDLSSRIIDNLERLVHGRSQHAQIIRRPIPVAYQLCTILPLDETMGASSRCRGGVEFPLGHSGSLHGQKVGRGQSF